MLRVNQAAHHVAGDFDGPVDCAALSDQTLNLAAGGEVIFRQFLDVQSDTRIPSSILWVQG